MQQSSIKLDLSEEEEKNPQKQAIFKVFRTWKDARVANVFPAELKKEMQMEENKYHLEQIDTKTWKLYRVLESVKLGATILLKAKDK